ncbi:MAG TPA: PGPGW domain-containing protein [Patescibacteria group bacterium]|nr:PGPGW domain-containing protein [Patescibacteria group bacterium]
MRNLPKHWKRVPAAVRKPLILVIGSAVILTGLAMLILPGPGWAAIFLGFAILATEFAFAEKVRDWLIALVKTGAKAGLKKWRAFVLKFKPGAKR